MPTVLLHGRWHDNHRQAAQRAASILQLAHSGFLNPEIGLFRSATWTDRSSIREISDDVLTWTCLAPVGRRPCTPAPARVIKRGHLALYVRKRLPKPIRRALRLGRWLFSGDQSSSWVPAELLSNCRMCASRSDLARLLPHGGLIAEVGTDRGQFARHILTVCDPARLHLIDLDFSRLEPAVAQDARVVMHNGDSHKVLKGFPDASFDWIYIDAEHSYAGVSRDANAAASKVKPGGYLVFNDFAHVDLSLGFYGVHRAVVDFAVTGGWRFAWFAYEPSALYDVALQRPQISN